MMGNVYANDYNRKLCHKCGSSSVIDKRTK